MDFTQFAPLVKQEFPAYEARDDSTLMAAMRKKYSTRDDSAFHKAMLKRFGDPEVLLRPAEEPEGEDLPLGEALKQGGIDLAKEIGRDMSGSYAAIAKTPGLGALEKAQIPDMSYQDLLGRGYTPEVAKNVLRQRIGTQQEMAEDLSVQAKAAQGQAARGAAFYGSTLVGGGVGAAVEGAIGKEAVKHGLKWVTRHALEGGAGVGVYEAAKAALEGKSASEIFEAATHGAVIGTIAGPVLAKGLSHSWGAVKAVGNIPRYVHEGYTAAAARQMEALASQATSFVNKFKSGMMKNRFDDLADPKADPREVAVKLIERVLGKDVLDVTNPADIDLLAEKISSSYDYVGIDPSLRRSTTVPADAVTPMETDSVRPNVSEAPSTPAEAIDSAIEQSRMRGAAAAGRDLPYATSGAAVDPNAVDMGPVGEQFPRPIRPQQDSPFDLEFGEINPVEGLERATPAAIADPELQLEPTRPPAATGDMGPAVGTVPSSRLTGSALDSDVAPNVAPEPNPRDLAGTSGIDRAPGEDILNKQLDQPKTSERPFKEIDLPTVQEQMAKKADSKIAEIQAKMETKKDKNASSPKNRKDFEALAEAVFVKAGKSFKEFKTSLDEASGNPVPRNLAERMYRQVKNKGVEMVKKGDLSITELPMKDRTKILKLQSTGMRTPHLDELRTIERELEGRTMLEAADWLSKSAPTPALRSISEKVFQRISKIDPAEIELVFKIIQESPFDENFSPTLMGPTTRMGRFKALMGTYKQAKGVAIFENPDEIFKDGYAGVFIWGSGSGGHPGSSYQTVLHELLHVATQRTILDAKSRKVPGSENVKMMKVVNELENLLDEVVQHFLAKDRALTLSPGERTLYEATNAIESVDELISWGFTDPEFQEALKSIKISGPTKTLWTRFVSQIRQLLGIAPNETNALTILLELGDQVIDDTFVESAARPAAEKINQGRFAASGFKKTKDITNQIDDFFGGPQPVRQKQISDLGGQLANVTDKNEFQKVIKDWGTSTNQELTTIEAEHIVRAVGKYLNPIVTQALREI